MWNFEASISSLWGVLMRGAIRSSNPMAAKQNGQPNVSVPTFGDDED